MRNLTRIAIASVFVAGACGVLHMARGDLQAGVIRTNSRVERQLIRQGAGQQDQNLKLLFAAKIFATGGIVSDRKDRDDREGRSDNVEDHSKPSS